MAARVRWFILMLVAGLPLAQAAAQEAAPPAATGAGPTTIVGTARAANFAIAEIFKEPVVALVDATRTLPAETGTFVPPAGQILGFATAPLFAPGVAGTYQINLPAQPTGATLDADRDGAPDGGVQVFSLLIAANIVGDSYLFQTEQSGLGSVLRDPATGEITQGSLLVHAADDRRSFPSGAGADGRWFSGDDPAAPLAPGYSVVRLGADGTATVDRSPTATIDTVERSEAASPDYSGQGILESYDSLIERLRLRYSFTELRQLDWDRIKAEYRPRVQEADAAGDGAAYLAALFDLAGSVEDTHVSASVVPGDPAGAAAVAGFAAERLATAAGNLGLATAAVSDPARPNGPTNRVEVVSVGAGSPAEAAGIVPGTEIVSVDGQPTAERLDQASISLSGGKGTAEGRLVDKAQTLLRFPIGTEVALGYRLPGTADVRTTTFAAGEYATGQADVAFEPEHISYTIGGGYLVLRWDDFLTDTLAKVAVMEEALAELQYFASQGYPLRGIILDLRGNSGGWEGLYIMMASYFFAADAPLRYPVFDNYSYSDAAGDWVRSYSSPLALSSPKPELAYTGQLGVLIDENCASSCEFFAQTLQAVGRARVLGQYASAGAGANIDRVLLPGGLLFQYTVGRSTYAGTGDYNLEARGVTPDVRLPITAETESAKAAGEDPVLALAPQALAAEQAAAATPAATPAAATPAPATPAAATPAATTPVATPTV